MQCVKSKRQINFGNLHCNFRFVFRTMVALIVRKAGFIIDRLQVVSNLAKNERAAEIPASCVCSCR